jgi:hypothetical protein
MEDSAVAQPWRTGEEREVSVEAYPVRTGWDGAITVGATLDFRAGQHLTFVQGCREKEILTMLRFGRDLNWSWKIMAASALDETTSLSITCHSDWADCDGSISWVWTKFYTAAEADQIAVPPAFSRPESTWDLLAMKENNSMHLLVREELADGFSPEYPRRFRCPNNDPVWSECLNRAQETDIRQIADERYRTTPDH